MSNRMSSPTSTTTLSQNNISNTNNNHAQSKPMQIINNSIQDTSSSSTSFDSSTSTTVTNNNNNSHHVVVAGFMSPTLISDYCNLMSLGNTNSSSSTSGGGSSSSGGGSSNSKDNNTNTSKSAVIEALAHHMMDYSKNRVSSFLPLSEIMANDQESIRNETVSKILTEHDNDNLIRVMSFHPEFLNEFVEFYNFLMYGRYGALASDARHFIAIMAASRHKCIYLVEQQEREFLLHNGPRGWLRGLDHVPSKLKDLLELNKLLCHRPWAVDSSHIEKILKSSNSWTLNELITAVVIIIQFHALSGMAFGCGVNENYLQQLAVKKRSEEENNKKKDTSAVSGGKKVNVNKSKPKSEEAAAAAAAMREPPRAGAGADYVLEEDADDADLLVVERDNDAIKNDFDDDVEEEDEMGQEDEDESDLDEDFYDDEDLNNDTENDKNTMTSNTSELFGEKEVVRNVNESSSGNHSLEEIDYDRLNNNNTGLNGSTASSSTFQYTSQRTLSDSSASSCELGLDMLVKEMQLIKDQNCVDVATATTTAETGVGDKNNNSINIVSHHHESLTITNNTPSSNNHSYQQTNDLLALSRTDDDGDGGTLLSSYQLDHHIIHSKRKHKSDDSDSARQSLDLKKPSPSSVVGMKSTTARRVEQKDEDHTSSRFNFNTASIRERKELYMQRFTKDMSFGYIECEKDDESLKLEYYTWENQGYVTAHSIQPDMCDHLDKTFKVAAYMTYNTMGTFKDVDTSLFRRAIWHYIHMLFGVRYDDYDYKQIKLLLKSPLRKYIRIVCTCPERVTRRHYDSIMREFRHSEKVHLNLVIMEARVQCALLYFLRSVNSFYGS